MPLKPSKRAAKPVKAHRDNYWVVVYNTGGYGNWYGSLADAQVYADAANRYSEQHFNERVVRELRHYVHGELVKTMPA